MAKPSVPEGCVLRKAGLRGQDDLCWRCGSPRSEVAKFGYTCDSWGTTHTQHMWVIDGYKYADKEESDE